MAEETIELQVKGGQASGGPPLGPKLGPTGINIQEVVAAMKYYDCDKSMVITTGKFTKGAFELAGRNGVQLIDKKGLDDLFDFIL